MKFYQFLKINNRQILRFLVSGLIASTFNYLLYSLIFYIFSNLVFASICGYFMGLLVSFIFAKIWVFRIKSKQPIIKSFFLFCLIYILGGIEMSFVIVFLNQFVNNHNYAWFFGALIGATNNYFGSKYLLFSKKSYFPN